MKISTRARYGVRALIDLALHEREEPILLKDIAKRQDISLHYLEHLITTLVAGGIVRSTRGARGGIWLIRPPDKLKLSEIVRLFEGSTAPVECVVKPDYCPRSGNCVTRDIWTDLKNAIDGVLESVTLQELVDRQRRRERVDEKMYYI